MSIGDFIIDEMCLDLKICRKTRYFAKNKLAWDVHSSEGRRISRLYKPLKVRKIVDISRI